MSRRPAARNHTVAVVTSVVVVSLGLGVLTAYGQEWLPAEVGSLANSSGSWCLAAFLLAMLASRPRVAAACGVVSLLMLLVGYSVANELRGFAAGTRTLLFWGTAAVLAGPLLGLGAYWVRFGRDVLAALGVGALSGVLVGEGVYGLAYIADTTSPPYWWGQIGVGLTLLGVVVVRRLRRPAAAGLALVVAAATAALFVVVYSQSSGLLSVLP